MIPPPTLNFDMLNTPRPKDKVVIVMGATGTGKSRLSIDLATRFPAEIINSDKIQVHQGLDILTNKITEEERRGVPHHLLSVLPPTADFTSANFRDMCSLAIESSLSRGHLPIIVGGSNTYIEALVDDDDMRFRSRYECCFLWVDVSMPVLHSAVSKRVDRMVDNGMVEEVRSFFKFNADCTRGIRKAIGVPELDKFFMVEPFLKQEEREKLLEEAIQEIKKNTCKLARRQSEKIHRLRNIKKWNIHRLDATGVLLREGSEEAEKAWEMLVSGPSAELVCRFLFNITTRTAPPNVAAIREHIAHCLVA